MRDRPVNYVDLLGWALAESNASRFRAEPTQWHKFVYSAKQLFPELFKYVIFDLRNPEYPYSEQADHALHVLSQAGVLRVGNPTYRYMEMDNEQRDALLASKPNEYRKYGSVIETLSEIAKKQLVA